MTATLRDVAEKAGVSKITVSRVINGKDRVSVATEARVRVAIEELKYVPNQLASSLRSRQTATLALLLPDITNSYWTTIARGVEDEAERRGFSVFLCNTDEDPRKEAQYLDLAIRRRVDGIVIGPTPDSAPLLQGLVQRQTKFVLVDRIVEGIDADVVRGDSYSGAYALTEHLLDTRYKRVAFVGGPLSTSTGLDRMNGYKAALAVAGRSVNPDLIRIGGYSQKSGYRLVEALLDLREPPDAVLTGNNQITFGALLALERRRKVVPCDLALVAFDDITAMNFPIPFLTAAAQPAYRIGRLSAERLVAQIAGDSNDIQDLILPVETVIRRSCGCNSATGVATASASDHEAVLAELPPFSPG